MTGVSPANGALLSEAKLTAKESCGINSAAHNKGEKIFFAKDNFMFGSFSTFTRDTLL